MDDQVLGVTEKNTKRKKSKKGSLGKIKKSQFDKIKITVESLKVKTHVFKKN
jgi:hypothetical protein